MVDTMAAKAKTTITASQSTQISATRQEARRMNVAVLLKAVTQNSTTTVVRR